MCLNEKLSHNIKVRSRISEFFLLKKNDFLKLSVNFQEQIQSFLSNSLLKYLKFNDEKKKIIKKFEKEHPEKFKNESDDDDEESKKEGNLELIKEDSEEEYSNGDSPKRKRKATMNSNQKSKSKSNSDSNSDSDSKSAKSNSSSQSKKEKKNSITRKSFLRAPKSLMNRINSIGSQNDDYNSIFEIKQEVDNVKKNMFKNFNKNLEKMLSILEKNKDKFDNLELKTNPMFYLRKMKNTKDQNEREEYLTQLRALIESDDESENDDN